MTGILLLGEELDRVSDLAVSCPTSCPRAASQSAGDKA